MFDATSAVPVQILHSRLVGAIAVRHLLRQSRRRVAENERTRGGDVQVRRHIRVGHVHPGVEHPDLHPATSGDSVRARRSRVDCEHVPLTDTERLTGRARTTSDRPQHLLANRLISGTVAAANAVELAEAVGTSTTAAAAAKLTRVRSELIHPPLLADAGSRTAATGLTRVAQTYASRSRISRPAKTS